jgi:hypothetical protein
MSQYGTAQYGSSTYGSTAQNTWTTSAGHIEWMLQVDWDGDGLFGSEIEPQKIFTLRMRRGRRVRVRTDGQGQEHPGQESFWVEIRDENARYDSFNSSSPLYSYLGATGMAVRILAVNTTTKAAAEPMFVGALTNVEYDAKSKRATLSGEGMARLLSLGAAEKVFSGCQSSSLNAWDSWFVVGSTPFPVNYWSGRTGGLYLQECVALVLQNASWAWGQYRGAAEYYTDQPDFFYLDGSSAWEKLQEIADGFCARIFFLRDGQVFLMDRQDSVGLHSGLSAAAHPLEAYGLERPSPFESLRNVAEVAVRPHSASLFNNPAPVAYYVEAWANGGPVAVSPGSDVELDVQYLSDGRSMYGSFVRVNDSVSDAVRYAAYSAEDRTGTDMKAAGTAEYSVLLQQVGENVHGLTYVPYGNNQQRARVRLRNYSATATAYFFDLKMLVIGIRETGTGALVSTSDLASVTANGQKIFSLDNPWVQNSLMGWRIAQAYVDALSNREYASPVTLTYAWSGNALYDNLLSYQVGCHVDFGAAGGATALANYGLHGRWLIVGQELEWIAPTGQNALVRLTYERAPVEMVTAISTSIKTGAGVSSLSWSHTVASGDNRLLAVVITKRAYAGTAQVTSVTFGGVALTKRGGVQQGSGDYPRVEIWYLVAPAVSTGTIVVTLDAGTDYMQAGATDFVNVHQSAPVGSPVYDWGAAGPGSADVSSEYGDLVLDGICCKTTAPVVGNGQTVLWSDSCDGVWKGAASAEPGLPTTNMYWVVPSGGFAQMAMAIKHV